MKFHLEKRTALLVSILGLSILSGLGVFVVLRIGNWYIMFGDDSSLVTAQIGWFYGAIFASQLPAITFVALVIGCSRFRNPILVAGLVALLYHMTMFGIRFARQSGAFAFDDAERAVAVGFEVLGLFSLVLIVMGITWLLGRASKSAKASP